MTKAEVFLIVQPTKQHRIVWGSPGLKADYENGILKTTVGQELLSPSPEETEGQSASAEENGPSVDPMAATPGEMIDMSPTLANVLGHIPNTRRRTPPGQTNTSVLANVPSPVREVLRRRPRARLQFNEIPPTTSEQTEITFVSDESVLNNLQ